MRQTYKVTFRKRRRTIDVGHDDYILDAAEDAGLTLPYGCRYGGCVTCAARLVDGQVDQNEGVALSAAQQARGYVLLCIAYPRSDCTFVTGAGAQQELFVNPFKKATARSAGSN
ncbi:MAG TPA: 2Fe-2S iron-sulfur cluster-binding protein [Candidatus Sulfomarinibacteraceae bacterium]|nr:2Fe-2S iron-sulfur cluster-binding protein [Candidatus Sulfomarinibacteraceae bacterium]